MKVHTCSKCGVREAKMVIAGVKVVGRGVSNLAALNDCFSKVVVRPMVSVPTVAVESPMRWVGEQLFAAIAA